MTSRRSVCVVVTARASYARIKTVMRAIERHPDLSLQLVVGASALLERYGPVIDVIRADGFEPSAVVYMVVEGENLVTSAKSVGMGVIELATAFDRLRPDVVVTVADRYETIGTAIAAAYLNIPVAHVQGGEITGSIDEKVRHAVTKLADLHLVANEQAARRVIQLGEEPSSVHVTGCPSIDLAAEVCNDSAEYADPLSRFSGVGQRFDLEDDYLVVVQHPVTTTYGDAVSQVTSTLEAVRRLGKPALWFWPNVDAGSDRISKTIRVFRETHQNSPTYFLKNLPPEDFLRVLRRAKCLVGNSSAGIREAGFLGVPVVNIGERQAGRDRSPNVLDVPYDCDAIEKAVRRQWEHGPYPSTQLYGSAGAGQRIANLLARAPLTIEKKLPF